MVIDHVVIVVPDAVEAERELRGRHGLGSERGPYHSFTGTRNHMVPLRLECPRFGGHLSAWSALSGWAGRIVRHAKGIELQEAVPVGVSA